MATNLCGGGGGKALVAWPLVEELIFLRLPQVYYVLWLTGAQCWIWLVWTGHQMIEQVCQLFPQLTDKILYTEIGKLF